MREKLDDLLHALQAAQTAVIPYLGNGSVFDIDAAATNALRATLQSCTWGMRVAIGEGRNDDMPGLFRDEFLGNGPFLHEIAVDPIDGTTPAANLGMQQQWKQGQVVSALALAPIGTIYYPSGSERRMERIAAPGKGYELSLDASPAENVERIAAALRCARQELTAIVVSPHRNGALIEELKKIGLPILTPKCGLGLELAAFIPRLLDRHHIVYGIGGEPETVVLAAAVRASGGTLLARLWCLDEEERQAFVTVGTDVTRVYQENELVRGSCGVVAVGITDGPIPTEGVVLSEEK